MKYVTEEEKEKALIEAKNKVYDDKELTKEEQDILHEYIQEVERLMSPYSDGGPRLPIGVNKFTRQYSNKPLNFKLDDISDFLKRMETND